MKLTRTGIPIRIIKMTAMLMIGIWYCAAQTDSIITGVYVSELIVKDQTSSSHNSNEEQIANEQSYFWNATTAAEVWSKSRPWLADNGIEAEAIVKADILGNWIGGKERRGSYIHNIDLLISVDAGKLFGWNDGSIFVQGMSNNGGTISDFVGDAQAVSNIEAGAMTKIYQAWLQHELWDGKVSILAGLYDLNSEFYVTQITELFINSSFGIGKDFSQTGYNGPSIFPTTSAAGRLKIRVLDDWFVQTAVFDALPGNPDNPFETSIYYNDSEGALLVFECGYNFSKSISKFAAGAWKYTSSFEKLDEFNDQGIPIQSTNNTGFYVLSEQTIYSDPVNPNKNITGFFRFGFAQSNINRFDYNFGCGLIYKGIFYGDENEALGIGITQVHNGLNYVRAAKREGIPVADYELTCEISYRTEIFQWLSVRPDFQYVIYPDTGFNADNACMSGVRLEIQL